MKNGFLVTVVSSNKYEIMLWKAYYALMVRAPLLTNMCTSGVCMFTGDTTAQWVELNRSNKTMTFENWKPTRTLIAVGWNSLLFTPLFAIWFRHLDKWFPGTAVKTVMKKVVLNQCVVAIPINAGFLSYTTAVEQMLGHGSFNPLAIKERVTTQLTEDLPGLFVKSNLLWFPVNTLNFLFVPPTFRVLPTIFVSTGWSTYLSLTAHKREKL